MQNKVSKRAFEFYEAGDADSALKCLEAAPESRLDGDGWHLLGGIYASQGRQSDAKKAFSRAGQFIPGNASLQYNQAKLLIQMGEVEEAEQLLCQLHDLFPLDAKFSNELGAILFRRNELVSASEYFNRALAVSPGFPSAALNLAAVKTMQGRFTDALSILDSSKGKELASWRLQHATILQLSGEYSAAVAEFGQMLAQNSIEELSSDDLILFFTNYGAVLVETGRYVEAESLYQKAQGLVGKTSQLLVNEALYACKILHSYARAAELFSEAILRYPDEPDVCDAYGIYLLEMGQVREAVIWHERALDLRPDFPVYKYNYSKALMAAGRLELAWEYYESRWVRPEGGRKPDYGCPEWLGEDANHSSIIVYREQGLGDELMFAPCLVDLAAKFRQIVFACHPKLVTLFSRSYPEVIVIPNRVPRHKLAAMDYDYQLAVGSLPRFFRRSAKSFPVQPRGLIADPIRTQHWKERLGSFSTDCVVGLAWRSSLMAANRNVNYLPLQELAPLFELPGLRLINLQSGVTEQEQAWLDEHFPGRLLVANEIDLYDDLDATACLIAACDLVICAGTYIQTMAGALNVPTLLMSPTCADSWMLGNDVIFPWLPSVTYICKSVDADWSEVVQRIVEVAANFINEKNVASSKVVA